MGRADISMVLDLPSIHMSVSIHLSFFHQGCAVFSLSNLYFVKFVARCIFFCFMGATVDGLKTLSSDVLILSLEEIVREDGKPGGGDMNFKCPVRKGGCLLPMAVDIGM